MESFLFFYASLKKERGYDKVIMLYSKAHFNQTAPLQGLVLQGYAEPLNGHREYTGHTLSCVT